MSKQEIPIASEWEINQQQKIHIINFNVKYKLFEGGCCYFRRSIHGALQSTWKDLFFKLNMGYFKVIFKMIIRQ